MDTKMNEQMRETISDNGLLHHIYDAICRIFTYIDGQSKKKLSENEMMMCYAIVKNIEIIGDASCMLSDEFKAAHTETPWKQITDMGRYMYMATIR